MKELWSLGHPVTGDEFNKSKYWLLGKQLDNYRVIFFADIIGKDLDLPKYVYSFISSEGAVLMIANIVDNECISILMRSLIKRAFIDYGYSKGVFYGIGSLKKPFVYGDPVLLVEGVADRDSLLTVFPNILSVKSSSLSKLQVELVSRLTNKVALMFDNDEAGRNGNLRAVKLLSAKGVSCQIIRHPYGVKDSGTIYDNIAQGKVGVAESLLDDYSLRIKGGISCLGS